jgi:hypothetical protein
MYMINMSWRLAMFFIIVGAVKSLYLKFSYLVYCYSTIVVHSLELLDSDPSIHSTAIAQPLASIMLATGHRCSVCSLRSLICSSGILAPLAAKTRIVPDTCCNREGTGGSISIGSCNAPRSSLVAVKENTILSITSLLGFI